MWLGRRLSGKTDCYANSSAYFPASGIHIESPACCARLELQCCGGAETVDPRARQPDSVVFLVSCSRLERPYLKAMWQKAIVEDTGCPVLVCTCTELHT